VIGITDSGTRPAVGPGFEVGASIGFPSWSLGLRVGTLTPTKTDTARGGKFWLGAVEFAGCARPLARRPVFLEVCLLTETGQLIGTGTGVSSPTTKPAFWLAPGARLTSGFRLGGSGFWALVGVNTLVPATRPEFVLSGSIPVHRPEPFVGRFEVGVLKELR
jgi:hypothetical protein